MKAKGQKKSRSFKHLLELCRTTNVMLQMKAARSIDISLVVRNWLFGWYIVEFEKGNAGRAEIYGKDLINSLSAELKRIGIKGVSPTNIRKFREFYEAYSEHYLTDRMGEQSSKRLIYTRKIQQTVSVESFEKLAKNSGIVEKLANRLVTAFGLGWSHYIVLLTLDNAQERRFYEIEAINCCWSVRELERQIAGSLYERLALSRDKNEVRRLAEKGLVVEKVADIVKNPLILEFLELEREKSYSESELESAIIDKLENFLLELGKGFLFSGRQKRFTFDNEHFYVDLVFYNRLLRCHVLVDLKRDKITHQDLGQMQMYVNYFDRYVKSDDEAPTIGIILCHRKNDALVELTLPKEANIYAAKYQLYLPSKEVLRKKLLDWGR